jgi:hypothetical protein
MSIYWQVGDTRTQSKGEALLLANGDLSKIRFNFHDVEWINQNYDIEPENSFEQLALERCKYLRDNGKWLSLWLSSGYDSNTILDFFIKSKQKLDEIVIYKRAAWDIENSYALKRASDYKQTYNINCKITFFSLTHKHHAAIYENMKEDWILAPGLSARFSKSSLTWNVFFPGDGKKTIDKNDDKRIDITGFDKPRVTLHQNKWYAMYPDSVVHDLFSDRFTGFYIDENDFDLYLKQHYMVISWFEKLKNFSPELVHQVQSHQIYYKEWNIACGRSGITNNFSSDGFGKGLFSHSVNSIDSQKLQEYYKDSKSFEYYKLGLEKIKNVCTWWNFEEDLAVKSVLLSKMKFLRNFKYE